MHAIEIKTVIDRTHRLQTDPPPDTPEGEAEVIVLPAASGHAPAGSPQDAAVAPMGSLRAFLHDFDSRPLAQPRSALEVEAQIAESRASWD